MNILLMGFVMLTFIVPNVFAVDYQEFNNCITFFKNMLITDTSHDNIDLIHFAGTVASLTCLYGHSSTGTFTHLLPLEEREYYLSQAMENATRSVK